MTTDGSSGTQQLQPGLRQAAGRQQPPATASAAPQPGQPAAAAGLGAIAFASAGTLDKPTPTAPEQPPGAQLQQQRAGSALETTVALGCSV